jgi:hydrogenase-4 component E
LETWISGCVMAAVLSSFWVLASSRLLACLRAVALQGAALAAVPLLLLAARGGAHGAELGRTLLLAGASLGFKSGLMPWLLWRAIRTASIRREVEPLVGFGPSLLLGALLTGLAFWGAGRLGLPLEPALRLLPAGGLATLLLGLLVLVGRTKAVTQVVGYLMVENGIFLVGLLLHREMPLMVEAGILLDVFAGVLIMGIFAYRIQRTFDHMDTHNLVALKD